MAELAGGGEPNGDDAAGAGAKGDAVADAGEPKRPPPAGAAPNGGGGEPNGNDAAEAGAKGGAVAEAGEPKRPPPAGAAPKGDWEAAPPPKGDAAGGATTPNGMGLPEAIGALTTAPAASGTIEGISAILSALGAKKPVGRGTQPSLPQPA